MAVVLFHLLLPFAAPALHPAPVPYQRLRQVAEQMARQPGLSQLANDLKNLATKLEQSQISPQEKHDLIREMEKRIEEQ